MGKHILEGGYFQSIKYPNCPLGLIPFAPSDENAQDLLYEYAVRVRETDPEFANDLMTVLLAAGYQASKRPHMGPQMVKVPVPPGFHSCLIAISDEVLKLLERLVDTGLFGDAPGDAALRLVEQGLEKRFFIDEPHA